MSIGIRAAIVLLAGTAMIMHARQKDPVTGKTILGDKETCNQGETCVCGSPPIDVKVGCECQIDSLGKTGTQHCPVDKGGGPGPLTIGGVGGFIGGIVGAALTLFLRRRAAG